MIAGLIGMMAAAAAAAGDAPAPAAPPSPPAATAPLKPAVNDNPMEQIECRRLEETGSRLGGKSVCLTRQQWLDQAREAREMTEQSQNRGLMTKTPGN